MPRIDAPSVAENRAMRRDHLVTAAADRLREHGTVSLSAVARDVGLSRSAVYEYYSSAADLIADVIVDEMAIWADTLEQTLTEHPTDPLRHWIAAALGYAAEGRHAFMRAAASIPLPPVRRAQVHAMHRGLLAPLVNALGGDASAARIAHYIWAVTEAAMHAIDDGADAAEQADLVWLFCQAGLPASIEG
jgi:AcrR family transcriptional regulator